MCPAHHHDISTYGDFAKYKAIQRATDEELSRYPRIEWRQLKTYLNNKFQI
jgi:hypothetical protein